MNLILVSLAAFWGWEFIAGLSPWKINPRLAPLLVAALSYGATFLPGHILLALAAAGGVAVIRAVAKATRLPPPSLPSLPRPRRISPPPGARGTAPPSQVGRRIPRL